MSVNDIHEDDFGTISREITESTGKRASVFVSAYTDNTDGLITGRVLASVTGTFYQGTNVEGVDGFFLKANPNNSGIIWFGVTGTVNNMFPLSGGDLIIAQVRNLNKLYFLGTIAGEDVRWLRA